MSTERTAVAEPPLEASHLEDLKWAASKMTGPQRRAFYAQMVLKYCRGVPRRGEKWFGWSRRTIQLALHEKRSGVICLGAQEAFCGNKAWEEKHPEVATALRSLAESHAQQDPSFRGALAYTRLTAKEALNQLRLQGFAEDVLPSPSTMAEVLNRNGYRLRPVLKAKPQKKSRKRTASSQISGTRTVGASKAATSSA
jgi:hypothetical protein